MVLEEDVRQRRFQMREMKENLWKWRGKKTSKRFENETEESKQRKLEEKLKDLKNLLEQSRRDKEERLRRAEEKSNAVKKIINEKERRKEEKSSKKLKKERLEDSWITMCWVTNLLEDNEDIWKRQEDDVKESGEKRLEEWGKMTRLRKVAELEKKYKLPEISPSESIGKMKKKRILPAWMLPGTSPEPRQPGMAAVSQPDCRTCSPSHMTHDRDNQYQHSEQMPTQAPRHSPSPVERQPDQETDHPDMQQPTHDDPNHPDLSRFMHVTNPLKV